MKRHKYGATKSYRCGACGGAVPGGNGPCHCGSDAVIKFDSKREAARYDELRIIQSTGKIRDLRLQPKYPLVVNGHKIGTYSADFIYSHDDNSGRVTVEDVKSSPTKTTVYRLKKRMVEALYGIQISEVS